MLGLGWDVMLYRLEVLSESDYLIVARCWAYSGFILLLRGTMLPFLFKSKITRVTLFRTRWLGQSRPRSCLGQCHWKLG